MKQTTFLVKQGERLFLAFQKILFGASKLVWGTLFALVLLVMILVFAYGVLAPRERSKLRPPEGMKNVEDFTSRFGREHSWVVVLIDGKTLYEARKRAPTWTLPSGEACYIFDEKGHFLGWTPDNGDDTRWNEKWGQDKGRQPIPFDEMIDKIRGDT